MSKRLLREIGVGIVASLIAAFIVKSLSAIGVVTLAPRPQDWGIYIYIAIVAFGFYFLGVAVTRRFATSPSTNEQRALIVPEMQNMVLVHWADIGPTLVMNKSPQLQMIRLHVCNRIPEKLKLKHITLNLMAKHVQLQELQRYFDQTIPAHDCGDLVFQLTLDANTADTLQSIDPSVVSLQGTASVSVGEQDFFVSFNTSTTFSVFLDPNALQS